MEAHSIDDLVPPDPLELALYRDVVENPLDDTPRLVYADYLEENDRRPALSGFIRRQLLPPSRKKMDVEYLKQLFGRKTTRYHLPLDDMADWLAPLFDTFRPVHLAAVYVNNYSCQGITDVVQWQFKRGFVDTIQLREADLMPLTAQSLEGTDYGVKARRLFMTYPITKVILLDKSPYVTIDNKYHWHSVTGVSSNDPDDVLKGVYDELRLYSTMSSFRKDYHNKRRALRDLSEAVVNWSRKQCGMQPLYTSLE